MNLMELLCIQSQEHPELPKAELKAVMDCENIDANLCVITEGLVILKDISTVRGDQTRLWRWAEIAAEETANF